MNYRKLFDRDKNNSANEEKRDFHSLRKVAFTSVFIVVALYFGVFYVVSGVVDRLSYNPTDVTQSKENGYRSPDFYYDMQAYISLNMPGVSNYSFTQQEAKGFGGYELSYSLRDLFTDKSQPYTVNISRGKLTYGIDGIFSIENRFRIWEGFSKIQGYFPNDTGDDKAALLNEEIQRKNEATIRYLKELNPLSYISMSIVFNEDLTMEKYYNMSQENSSLEFKWVGIRTVESGTRWDENQPIHLIGFNPNFGDEPSSNRRPDPEKYPIFYLMDMMGNSDLSNKDFPEAFAEAYRIHFRSRLEYMKNRDEFVNIFDYNHYKTDFYDDALVYIDKNGVNTYGVLVFGTAEEFLEKINEMPYDSLYINEVLPTKPNIYYD